MWMTLYIFIFPFDNVFACCHWLTLMSYLLLCVGSFVRLVACSCLSQHFTEQETERERVQSIFAHNCRIASPFHRSLYLCSLRNVTRSTARKPITEHEMSTYFSTFQLYENWGRLSELTWYYIFRFVFFCWCCQRRVHAIVQHSNTKPHKHIFMTDV